MTDFIYTPTHASRSDHSQAMFVANVGDTMIILVNEDGEAWTDFKDRWYALPTTDATPTPNVARRCAAIELALANKHNGASRDDTLTILENLTGDASLASMAAGVAFGSDDLNAEDALDDLYLVATDSIIESVSGTYIGSPFRDEARKILERVFAAGVDEGQATADFDFETGKPHFTDPTNPFTED